MSDEEQPAAKRGRELEPYARYAAKAMATPERLRTLEEFLKPLLHDPPALSPDQEQERG